MNLRDVYAQARLSARSTMTVSGEFHRLWLATARDRWYGGTGATSLRGNYFGFSVRPSRLAASLATYATASVEAVLHPVWTVGATAGVIKGGEIVRRQFSGTWSKVLLIESRISLGVKP